MSDFDDLDSILQAQEFPQNPEIGALVHPSGSTSSPRMSAFGSGSSSNPTNTNILDAPTGGAGGQDSDAKKRRGRPVGSKNKPKLMNVETKGHDITKNPKILEISEGFDIIQALTSYALQFDVSIDVHSCHGSVSSVILSHLPNTLDGPFNIVSFSGLILSGTVEKSYFTVVLAGMQGQMFAGRVDGKMIAASSVMVVVRTFDYYSIQVLPCEPEGSENDQKGSYDAVAAPSASDSHDSSSFMQWGPM